MTDSEQVTALIDSFNDDPNAVRIKKLLFCMCYGEWPSDRDALDNHSWFELLQHLLERAPDIDRLQNMLISVVAHLNKKNAYFVLARSLFNRLKVLYPDYRGDVTSMGNRFVQVRKILDDSQDLFSLRLRVSHRSSLKKAKGIVFAAISCRFDHTTEDLNYLNQHEFDDLVRELLYACNSIEDLRFRIFGAASCLDDRENNLRVATMLCGTIASLYPALDRNATLPLAGDPSLDDFDRLTAGSASLLDFDTYDDLEEPDEPDGSGFGLTSDITLATPMMPQADFLKTGAPRSGIPQTRPARPISTEWGREDDGDLYPGVRSDIKNYADRQLHGTIATLENNLQAVADYIDRNLGPNPERASKYKHKILRELVEGLQESCATQLDRLDRILENNMAQVPIEDGDSAPPNA